MANCFLALGFLAISTYLLTIVSNALIITHLITGITVAPKGNSTQEVPLEGGTTVELDLRQAINQRVQGKNNDELTEIIEGSIGHEEMALPGLGVLFEMIWNDSTAAARKKMVDTLHKHLAPQQA
nr:small acid-soluble spore protein SspI [Cohnella sp. WQ 127256]